MTTEIKKDNPLAPLLAMGVSRYRIAREMGVSDSTVRKWYRGEGLPNVQNSAKLEQLAERVAGA